jgi:hypothetical protein
MVFCVFRPTCAMHARSQRLYSKGFLMLKQIVAMVHSRTKQVAI